MKKLLPMLGSFLLLSTLGSYSQPHPLDQFLGEWALTSSTFGTTEAEITFSPVAGGLGVLSAWRQGEGDSFYEAVALWGFDAETEEVRVFEVNTIGVAILHVGHFDESGALTLEHRSEDGATVLEQRVFEWPDANTITMSAVFNAGPSPVHHSATMVRRK